MVGHSVARSNGLATPRTCSTTQPMRQSPLHQDQEAMCQTVPSTFGSVCNIAIRQDSKHDEENAAILGDNAALPRHLELLREVMLVIAAELEIESSPGDGYHRYTC